MSQRITQYSPVRDIGNTIRKCQRSRSDRAELSRVGAQFGRGIIYLFREIVKMKRYDLESGDVVPGWMEIEYCVAALRTQYLEEKLFAT